MLLKKTLQKKKPGAGQKASQKASQKAGQKAKLGKKLGKGRKGNENAKQRKKNKY